MKPPMPSAGGVAPPKLSKEARKARAPRAPEELVGALQDRIHPTSGRLLAAKPIALAMAALVSSADAADAGRPSTSMTDGGQPSVIDVERAEVLPSGADGGVSVVGGCWLSTEKCIDTAKELKRLRAENESLKNQPGSTGNTFWWVVGSFCVGAVVGGLIVAAQGH